MCRSRAHQGEALRHDLRVNTVPLEHFAWVARAYRAEVELPRTDVGTLVRLLAQLVAAATDLPDVDQASEQTASRPSGWAEDEERVRQSLRSWLPFDGYWHVIEPDVRDIARVPAPGLASLFDDLTEIYTEVRTGLALDEQGQLDEAAWHWRWTFRHHWGEHATSALSVQQRLLPSEPQECRSRGGSSAGSGRMCA